VIRIARESPNQPAVMRLIDELDAYQKPLYPAESHHGIDMDALLQPNVIFAVARSDADEVIGCGAIVLGQDYGELKRMFVSPRQRGQGIGKALLAFLESAAKDARCSVATLETGIYQPEALGLYERAGYVRCEPFGQYLPDPMSVFMRKQLRD
jgi:putative acetyltransferase